MSDSIGNYDEEVKPLFKMLQTEAFRLIFVRFNTHRLRRQLEQDLRERFPDRPQVSIDASATSYHSLMDSYYKLGAGFFFIDYFEEVLANPELYTGLNIRRDKLAQYPVAMICFLSPSAKPDWGKEAMEKMPDLWSFWNLILDLRAEDVYETPAFLYRPEESKASSSSLGGRSRQGKMEELFRLKMRAATVNRNEEALQDSLYEQIFRLQMDLRQYAEAVKTMDLSLTIGSKEPVEMARKISQRADACFRDKDFGAAVAGFEKAIEIMLQRPAHPQTASIYGQLGRTYYLAGYAQKAEAAFWDSTNIYRALLKQHSYDDLLLDGYARVLNDFSLYYCLSKQTRKALALADQAISTAITLRNVHPHHERALSLLYDSYRIKGNIYQESGDTGKALDMYSQMSKIAEEKAGLNPGADNIGEAALAMSMLANSYNAIGDVKRAENAYKSACDLYSRAFREGYQVDYSAVRSYSHACRALSKLLADSGRRPEALHYLQDAKSIIGQFSSAFAIEDVREVLSELDAQIQNISVSRNEP